MKKERWKKVVTMAVLGISIGAVGALPASSAGYTLNREVKNATPALRQAAQIGVRSYDNPAMQDAENKDAILVLSFGTTYAENRAATIDKTVAEIQAAHPDTKVVSAFTSHIIIDRIQQNEGITIPTPEQALEQLKKEGYTRVAVTTLNVIPGIEYDYNAALFEMYKGQFKKMTLGTPVLYWMGQENQRDDVAEFVQAMGTQFPRLGETDAVLVMAHGTPHPANAYYSVLQSRFDAAGLGNVFVYSVEGWPHLDTVIPMLKAKGIEHVTIMPMMVVAGDHANNDMAGSEEDSWKTMFEAAGFTVDCQIHGLGEIADVQALYVAHTKAAIDSLNA